MTDEYKNKQADVSQLVNAVDALKNGIKAVASIPAKKTLMSIMGDYRMKLYESSSDEAIKSRNKRLAENCYRAAQVGFMR